MCASRFTAKHSRNDDTDKLETELLKEAGIEEATLKTLASKLTHSSRESLLRVAVLNACSVGVQFTSPSEAIETAELYTKGFITWEAARHLMSVAYNLPEEAFCKEGPIGLLPTGPGGATEHDGDAESLGRLPSKSTPNHQKKSAKRKPKHDSKRKSESESGSDSGSDEESETDTKRAKASKDQKKVTQKKRRRAATVDSDTE
jgi:hypothetical protein